MGKAALFKSYLLKVAAWLCLMMLCLIMLLNLSPYIPEIIPDDIIIIGNLDEVIAVLAILIGLLRIWILSKQFFKTLFKPRAPEMEIDNINYIDVEAEIIDKEEDDNT